MKQPEKLFSPRAFPFKRTPDGFVFVKSADVFVHVAKGRNYRVAVFFGRAQAEGLEIDYRQGDCERLEGIEDGAFDVVSSTCGIMFAPDHAATARQLGRVLKPGGRLGLANWTPEGGLGAMFRMMAPFVQTPPPSSPFDWGKEDRVRELLGETFELRFEKHISMFRPSSGEEYWEIFSTDYGPTKALADSLGPRREEFHRTWVDFFEQNYRRDDGIAHDREWLLVLGDEEEDKDER